MTTPTATNPLSHHDQEMIRYYEEFRKFLAVDSAQDEVHKRRLQANRAQQKLLRLSPNQFYELATDVYDELQRRMNNSRAEAEFLTPNESLHPKRNQARKKLSLLSPTRFNDLAFDILFEIERRTPGVKRISKESRTSLVFSNDEHGQNPSARNQNISDPRNPYPNNSFNNASEPPPYTSDPNLSSNQSSMPRGNENITQALTSNPNNNIQGNHTSSSTNSTYYSDNHSGNGQEGSDISSPRSPLQSGNHYGGQPKSDIAGHTKMEQKRVPPPLTIQQSNGMTYPDEESPLKSPGHTHLQTSMVTPTKSTLVEETDDDDASEMSNDDLNYNPHIHPIEVSPSTPTWTENSGQSLSNNNISRDLPDNTGMGGEFHDSTQPNNFRGTDFNGIQNDSNNFQGESNARNLLHINNSNPTAENQRLISEPGLEQHSNMESQKDDFEATLKDKDEQIQLLVEEGTRMDETITKLEGHLAESEALKDTLVEENGRLHQLISEIEITKDNALSELETAKADFNIQTERYINELEANQRNLADLEVQHQKLKETHAEKMTSSTELAESKASFSTHIMALESKLLTHENTISSLQQELEQKNLPEPPMAREAVQSTDDWEKKYKILEEELRQQQLVTDQVRSEASNFLEEMRTLAENDSSWSSEKQSQQIDALKQEVNEWKARYAKSKAQVKNLRASTYGTKTAFTQPHVTSIEMIYTSPYGIVNDESVSKFQVAMDEFIFQSRASPSKGLLDHLHGVVIATRVITQEVGSGPIDNMSNLNPDVDQLQSDLANATSLVSATANHLITSTRNHSTSGGLSPIFLLDAAASDLSAAVIDLIKLAKVKISPGSTDPQQFVESPRLVQNGELSNGQHKLSTNDRGIIHETLPINQGISNLDSANHQTSESQSSGFDYNLSISPINRNRYGSVLPDASSLKFDTKNPAENTVIELQEYLENETVGVIDSIQELLTGIKGTANYHVLRSNITSITDSVRLMLAATGGMMRQSKHRQLKEHVTFIVDSLENCCQRMQVLYGDSAIYDESMIPDKNFKQRLAAISFDMAKCTTEFVKTVEEVNLKQEISQIDDKLQR